MTMKKKKPSKGSLGNVVESFLSGPIEKKEVYEEPSTSVDSVDYIIKRQTKLRSDSKQKKNKK